MSIAPASRRGGDLRAARDGAQTAARELRNGEQALVAVLRDLEHEKDLAAEAYRAIVRSLAAALEARDGYTGDHSDAVHQLSVAVAEELSLDAAAVEEVRTVALLHDIGKIGVPDHVLHKDGPLDEDEWELMRRHPVIGERILRPLPGMAGVAGAVRHEHERWDGGGYPDGLSGADIPLPARIVLACDAYNAMVSDRPYRRALAPDAARAELRRHAGAQFDPVVVDALLMCLDRGPAPVPAAAAPEPEARRARPEREVRALITVASAVAGAHRLDDVLEVAADAARDALGAASLSISRQDDERREIRTLINVGDLGPGEERRPAAEIYRFDDFPELLAMMTRGRPHVASVEDAGSDRIEVQLLRELGKASSLAVPIIFGGAVWGEMYATRAHGDPAFGARDVRFLEAICGQVAAAIGRAELFSHLSELAYADPLTGLANRRALDERLEEEVARALASGEDLALVVADLDGLKEINDHGGHAAGDRALVAAAGALAQVAERHAGAFVARLSGDEFAVLLPRCDADRARELAARAVDALADGPVDAALSGGVAALEPGGRPASLLRAADAALYAAKRNGRGRICLAGTEAPAPGPRRAVRGRLLVAERAGGLVAEGMAAIDRLGPDADREARLEAVLIAAAGATDAPSVALTEWVFAEEWMETLRIVDLRNAEHVVRPDDGRWRAADFPATVLAIQQGGWLHATRSTGDDAERAVLEGLDLDAVLAVGVPGAGRGWLLEVFADDRSLPLTDFAPALRALAAAAAH
jgi:diguanylate cyclase (GGDEF)-like protein